MIGGSLILRQLWVHIVVTDPLIPSSRWIANNIDIPSARAFCRSSPWPCTLQGSAVLVRGLSRHHPPTPTCLWLIFFRMLLRMIWWLVLLHAVEISIWALFYLWRGCLPNAEAAFYFSGVTYTTLWLRRRSAGAAVAAARTGRGLDGRPDVRLIDGILLRGRQPHPSIAHREACC